MKIAVFNWRCLAHPASGGAEVFTEEVLRHWAESGHEPTLISSAVAGRPADEVVRGIRHIRTGSRFGVYRNARRWWSEVGQDLGFDLVIDEINTRPFGCHQWVRGVPTVGLMHQLAQEVWFYETPLPVALLGRFVLEPRWLRSLRYSPVITVSSSSRQSFIEAGLQRVVTVSEGIDADPVSEPVLKEPVPTLVFVGRMASNKRPQDAVRAVELARRLIPDLQIHLIGEGRQKERLAARGQHVVAHGFVSNERKSQLVGSAHAQVVTSVREGWGLVVDEAARVGTPSISYDVAGLRDSVKAAGGWLVEPRPEAMAEAIVRLMPSLQETRVATGWSGGAQDWSTVADEVMAAALAHAECRPSAIDLDGVHLDRGEPARESAMSGTGRQAVR